MTKIRAFIVIFLYLLSFQLCFHRLSGCYESLNGGNTGDAVVDFSGAVAELIDLQAGDYCTNPAAQNKLFSDLLKVNDRGGIISCSIRVSTMLVKTK